MTRSAFVLGAAAAAGLLGCTGDVGPDTSSTDFQSAMLDQRVVSVGARLGEQGIDGEAATRWRRAIPGWADRWFRVVLGQRLRALGYDTSNR